MAEHILLIRTVWPHWGQFSGINQFINYIDTDRYIIEEHLTSPRDEDFPIRNPAVQKFLRNWIQKGTKWYNLSDLTAELSAFLSSITSQTDLIHFLTADHGTQFLPFLSRRSDRRTKIMGTYHQPPYLLKKVTSKAVIRRLDAVMVVSPEQIPYFTEIMDPERIHLILHGIDTRYFQPGSHSMDNDKFRCITVGFWLRDLIAVREVASRLTQYKNIEFHVIQSRMSGPMELGLEDLDNVILHRDAISDEMLREMYQKSHVLFLPLKKSTANNALLEGLSCGLPIVSTVLPSVQAYVSTEGAVLIDNNDPDRLAEAIIYLYENPDERRKMGRKSRERALELDWHRITPLIEDMYGQVIHE
jgi:glycosyltransferase involved in cell wall biosynthesis